MPIKSLHLIVESANLFNLEQTNLQYSSSTKMELARQEICVQTYPSPANFGKMNSE